MFSMFISVRCVNTVLVFLAYLLSDLFLHVALAQLSVNLSLSLLQYSVTVENVTVPAFTGL